LKSLLIGQNLTLTFQADWKDNLRDNPVKNPAILIDVSGHRFASVALTLSSDRENIGGKKCTE
jgi:hypothetical protein